MPSRSTPLVVRLLRRLFVCPLGHAFMWHRAPEGDWLECWRCLTTRVIAPAVRSIHA